MTTSKAANAPKKSKAANVPKSRSLLCGSEYVALVASDITVLAASESGRFSRRSRIEPYSKLSCQPASRETTKTSSAIATRYLNGYVEGEAWLAARAMADARRA
ncbi:MAG: hypothetical protein WAK35_06895 [Xanthobacteraceae bacterium]